MRALVKPCESSVGPLLNSYGVLVVEDSEQTVTTQDQAGQVNSSMTWEPDDQGSVGLSQRGQRDREAEKRPPIVEVAYMLRRRQLRKLSRARRPVVLTAVLTKETQ
jgi:hypothetical protein